MINKPKEISVTECEQFIKMTTADSSLKTLFGKTSLTDIWRKKPIRIPVYRFPTTYFCETGFSSYSQTKYRDKSDAV